MKELARRLMRTQLAQSSLQKEFIRTRVENRIINSSRRSLKPEGRPYFDDFVGRLQRGEKIIISSQINMLGGFDYSSSIKGLELIQDLKDKPILLVANHPNNGPLGGDWKNIVISYYIQQKLNQELRDLHGYDPTTIRDLFRIKEHVSTNSIPVRDAAPQRSASLLIQAIKNRDSMRLYPEGDGSKNLRRAIPDAGRFIVFCARNGMNIVSCSTRYQSETFFLTFDTIDSQQIKILGQKGTARDAAWQSIADYAMARIAKNLPQKRRGYYQNYQGIISGFEEPIAK
jgi:hypothetical protein